ncbi:CXCR1 protein, partial [Polyodon spathula]|nr:CXCR1 protein [Polyodon spathula]
MVSLVQEVNFYSSILFLAVISVDRYLAIVRAVQTRKQRQPFYSWLTCASVWVVGVLLSLPVLFHSAFKPSNSENTVCYEKYDPETTAEWRFATRLLRHSLGFLLPLTVMLVCYGITICRLLQARSFEKQKAMKVIVAVVLAFLICWMPYHLVIIGDTLIRFKLVSYTCEISNSISLGIFITQSLGLLHSCINPILYAFSNKNLMVCYEDIRAEDIEAWRISIRFLRHLVGFFIPLAIMIFCYGFTINTLFRTRSGQKHKAMRVIFAVVLAFIVFWFPYNMTVFVDTLMRAKVIIETCEVRHHIDTALQATQILAFLHCCINPILYAFVGQKFRNTFFRVLMRKGFIKKNFLSTYGMGSSYRSSSGTTSITL